MKNTISKTLLLSIFLLLIFMFSTGCGNDKPPDQNSAPSSSSQSPTESSGPSQAPAENTVELDDKEIISALITKGQEIKEMSYDMVMIGAGFSSESKVWFKGNMMKTDSVFNGQRLISVIDLSKGEVITYLPGDSMATKMKLEEYQGQDTATPVDYLQELTKADCRLADKETVNEMECQIIDIISVDGSYREWLSTEYGIPVKIEGLLQDQGTIEYKNINTGTGSVPADTFKLPDGMEIMDMQEMFQDFPVEP